ncbi:MAG: hypothetical protein J07HX5_00385, partial [halophilic archaeon J07HX5]
TASAPSPLSTDVDEEFVPGDYSYLSFAAG